MPERTVAETMHYCAIKLTAYCEGVEKGCGTGFFFEFQHNGLSVPAIITNRHVVKDCDHVAVLFHIGDGEPSGESEEYEIDLNDAAVFHPDLDVDMCAILIGKIIHKAQANGDKIFYAAVAMETVPPEEDWQYFDAMEEVVMIGCPNGLFDEENNLPIARRGITATPLNKKYDGRDEFMVDMACFPGSSGSPIFIFNQSGYFDRKTNSNMIGGQRLFLVGILYSGPEITTEGKIVLAKSTTFEVAAMMHLGYAIKATAIQALTGEIIKKLAPIAPPLQFKPFGNIPAYAPPPAKNK